MREAQLCLPEAYRAPVSLYILSLSGMLMLSCCKIYKSTKDNTYHEHCLYRLYLSLCESVCRVYMHMHVFIAQYTCDHFPSGWNQRSCQLCLNSQRWHQTCKCISLTFSHAFPLPFFYPPSSWLRITGRGGWMWCCCFFNVVLFYLCKSPDESPVMTTRWSHIIEQTDMTQQFCSAQIRIRMFFITKFVFTYREFALVCVQWKYK